MTLSRNPYDQWDFWQGIPFRPAQPVTQEIPANEAFPSAKRAPRYQCAYEMT